MKFTYMKTPLYKYTFRNRRIREWVESRCEGLTLNLFAGITELEGVNEIRNDSDPESPSDYHEDGLQLVELFKDNVVFETVLLDPPYSYRKSMEMYGGRTMSTFNAVKNNLSDLLVKDGIVITFGYHSVSMGKTRGFEQEEVLLLSHGGAIHDTVAIIERKII